MITAVFLHLATNVFILYCVFSELQRGSDVPHSPVMYSYLVVEVDQAQLFVDSSKVNAEVKDHLKNAGIELKPYDYILQEIDR